jgi:hypothetical protein
VGFPVTGHILTGRKEISKGFKGKRLYKRYKVGFVKIGKEKGV